MGSRGERGRDMDIEQFILLSMLTVVIIWQILGISERLAEEDDEER
jgi:hypothetical protein